LAEVVLNPLHFSASLATVLANLVHQMTHLWQQGRKDPPRLGYHDKSWASKMKLIGLHPSDTAEVGGRETGQRMSQFVISGGLFQLSMNSLLETGFEIAWMEALEQNMDGTKKSRDGGKSRVPWHCPKCGERAWAKPSAVLACGRCAIALIRR